MLHFEKVQKHYGTFLALNVPSISLGNGLWWLQGENGSGKTTFMKMIAGLHPFTGDIVIDDRNSIKKQRLQFTRAVNYAEAEPLYPPFLTAKDLVTLYCQTKNGSLAEAHELLKQLHIYDAYTKQVGTYSSGMVKKLSLTLAFIGTPKLILLDEPLITIDAAAITTTCNIIRSKFSSGISFIITSHQKIHNDELQFTRILKAENRTIVIAGE